MLRIFGALVVLWSSVLSAFAQKETSFWMDRFYSFQFDTFPPSPFSLNSQSNFHSGRATIADSSGNLLFYGDGFKFFDRDGKVMPNGVIRPTVDWGTTFLPMLIAPVPGHKTRYYFFTVRMPLETEFAEYDWSLQYSVVDMAANGGKGDVVESKVVLHDNARDEYTLMKTPGDTTGFWLVCVPITDMQTFLSFRFTAQGVSQPVVTQIGEFVEQSLLKASPDGKYLVALTNPNDGTHRLKIFTMNDATGSLSLYREIVTRGDNPSVFPNVQVWVADPEFSSNSRFLYVMKDSVFQPEINVFEAYTSLHCYDLQAPTQDQFLSSRKLIHQYPKRLFPAVTRMQLSPQRKIIVGDVSQSSYFGTIHNPNACEVADKNFEVNSVPLPNDFFLGPPVFAPWFFYEPAEIPNELFVGKDTVICPFQTVVLGATPLPGYTYHWDAAPGLSNLNSPNPTFQAGDNTTGQNDTTVLRVTATNAGSCPMYATVRVIVLPVNEWVIQGSRSVCPGVEDVKYWIDNGWDGTEITWVIDGGAIDSGQGTDTLLVDWGLSNPAAFVRAYVVNKNGCRDTTETFPVKVFKFLETETPNGRDTLLCDDLSEIYQIIPTNGSAYDWHVLNGTLLSGQGTHRVEVEWHPDSLFGRIWIDESVNTDIEVCFGRSDTLTVINQSQMLSKNLSLFNLTGTLTDNENLILTYALRYPFFYEPTLIVQRRGSSGWEIAGSVNPLDQGAVLPEQPLAAGSFEYRLVTRNLCGDSATSSIHRNIFLEEEQLPVEDAIRLTWNAYVGWGHGVGAYGIRRQIDEEPEFSTLANTNDLSLVAESNSDGFTHRFYVGAASADDKYASISNKLTVDFDHTPFFPNVITPNGDGKNDFWNPLKLHLFPENRLVIYNRWGKEVYQAENYAGEWDGGTEAMGVYFFEISLKRNRRYYKGIIHVIR